MHVQGDAVDTSVKTVENETKNPIDIKNTDFANKFLSEKNKLLKNTNRNNNKDLISHHVAAVTKNHFIYVQPKLTVPDVFELNYYSNTLVPIFAVKSLVGELLFIHSNG